MVRAPRRILVLVNAHARRAVDDPGLQDRLRALVGGFGTLRVTWSAADVEHALRAAGPLDDTVVAICGGDGSGTTVLSALAGLGAPRLPPVALLPAGTVNTIARRLGAAGRPEERLRRLVRAVEQGQTVDVRSHATLWANGRVGLIFGAGLVSNFYGLYNGASRAGRVWAAAQIGRIFVGSFVGSAFAASVMAPVPARLVVDGREAPLQRVTLLLASTLVDVGLGLRVTYRADRADGGFHLVATDLPAHRLGPQLPRALAGRPIRAERLVDELARDVVLRFREPGRFLVDGELFEAAEVRLRPGPPVDFVC